MSPSSLICGVVLSGVLITPAGAAATSAASPAHDVAFWRDIKARDFAVPEGKTPGPLLLEACDLLGSPDPELRDQLGYEIAEAWIYRRKTVSDSDLRPVIALLERNLGVGIGENGTDSVLRRSFSALVLSLVAARDDAAPFLTAEEFDGLLSAALEYLAHERDERGFVPGKGWHHSVAHTADLLKFLGRSPKLAPGAQRRILAGVVLKAGGSSTFWTWGEDDRLAAAVLSILKRDDFDPTSLDGWLDRFVAAWQVVRQDPLTLDPARFAAAKNGRNTLTALEVEIGTSAPFAAAERTRQAILATLRRM
jgi:uncharacterized protein DUF2785